MEHCLGAHGDHNNNDNHEHAANGARFVTVLSGLSEGAVRVVYEMTKGPVPEVLVFYDANAGLLALANEMREEPVTEVVLDNKNAGSSPLMNILAGLWALMNILAGSWALMNERREGPVTEVVHDNKYAGLWALMNVLAGLSSLLASLFTKGQVTEENVFINDNVASSALTNEMTEDDDAGLLTQTVRVNQTIEGQATDDVVLEIVSDAGPETSSYHTALSVISSLCTTTVQCTDSAASADDSDRGHDAFDISSGNEDDSDKCGCCAWLW